MASLGAVTSGIRSVWVTVIVVVAVSASAFSATKRTVNFRSPSSRSVRLGYLPTNEGSPSGPAINNGAAVP